MEVATIEKFSDKRGVIMFASPEILNLPYKYLTVGTIKPGKMRGGHYHKRLHKKTLCVSGILGYTLQYHDTDTILTGSLIEGEYIDIPPGYIITFTNIGKTPAVFIEFKNEEHDENDRFRHIPHSDN